MISISLSQNLFYRMSGLPLRPARRSMQSVAGALTACADPGAGGSVSRVARTYGNAGRTCCEISRDTAATDDDWPENDTIDPQPIPIAWRTNEKWSAKTLPDLRDFMDENPWLLSCS